MIAKNKKLLLGIAIGAVGYHFLGSRIRSTLG